MAEDALNKSLDELIKEQRQKDVTKKKRPERKSTEVGGMKITKPAGARKSGGAGSGNAPKQAPKTLIIPVKPSGKIIKRGGQRRSAPMVVDREKDNPQLRRAALDGGARWGHDMFAQVEPAAGRGPSAAGDDPRAPSSLGTKIFVANLDFKVESEDVKELFSTCGEVVSGRVHFLRGRKAGTGEAIFKERSAAVEAMKYNGVQLDGRPMELELIEQAAPDEGVRTLKSGRRVGGEPKLVAKTRLFEQAAAGVRQPRGRGSVRMGKDAMQE